MLVRDDPTGGEGAWLAIGQPAHAWVSGQAARAWGNEAFPAPSPREEVCLAAEQHDVGMAVWDLTPSLNAATGRAVAFAEMPRPVHVDLWSHAAEKLLTQSRYAALLVSLHGTTLYERYPSHTHLDLVEAYLEGQRALQRELQASLGAPDDEVLHNRDLLFFWDWLSLALCLEWAPAESGSFRLARSQDATLTLDPWPFADPEVTFQTEGRRLPGPFASEAELHSGLAAAPWTALTWRLVAPSGN